MERNNNKKRLGRIINDIVIYLVICAGFVFLIYCATKNSNTAELSNIILQFVGDFCIYLLGLVGIFEFCYDNNLTFLVPSRYSKHKDEDLRNKAREAFMIYFDNETDFIEKTVDARTAHVLSLLGLTSNDLKSLKAEALRAQVAPLTNLEDCRSKLKGILFNSEVILDISKTPEFHPDPETRYYMKTHDLLYIKSFRDSIVNVMAFFINETLKQKFPEKKPSDLFDLIMVPHSSNIFLGDGVSRKLYKPIIKMIAPEVAKKLPFRYENNIPTPKNGNPIRVIVVHDVLYSGDQIIESINTLKETNNRCDIVGVFCLVRRTVKATNAKKIKEECGCETYSLLEMSEDDIKRELGQDSSRRA